jgi:hypothetical protein
MSHHQSETVFRMSLTRDDTMKLGFHDFAHAKSYNPYWKLFLSFDIRGEGLFLQGDFK